MRPGVTDKRPRPICTILIEERRSTMNDVTNVALAESWRRLWNGDLGQLDAIVADTFVAHAAMLGGTGEDTLRGRAALGQWIERMHAVMTGLTFGIENQSSSRAGIRPRFGPMLTCPRATSAHTASARR